MKYLIDPLRILIKYLNAHLNNSAAKCLQTQVVNLLSQNIEKIVLNLFCSIFQYLLDGEIPKVVVHQLEDLGFDLEVDFFLFFSFGILEETLELPAAFLIREVV